MRLQHLPIGSSDADGVGVLNDMVVGDDVAIGRDEEARP